MLTLLENSVIGGVDGGVESCLGVLCARGDGAWGSEVAKEGFGGEVTGNFACGCPTHTVTDDEDVVLERSGTGILIAAADASGVGEHSEDEIFRLQRKK